MNQVPPRVHGLIVESDARKKDSQFVDRLFRELGDDAPVEVGGTKTDGLSDELQQEKKDTEDVLKLLSRESVVADTAIEDDSLPWDWKGIQARILRLIRRDEKESLAKAAQLFIPRLFGCVSPPPIFGVYRMILAMTGAVIVGSLFSALQGSGDMTLSDDVHTVVSIPAQVGLNYLKLIYAPLLFTTVLVSVAKLYMAKHLCERSKRIAVHGTFLLTTILAVIASLNGLIFGYLVMAVWDSADSIDPYDTYVGMWDFVPAEDGVFNTIFGDEGIIYTIFVSNIFVAFRAGNMTALLFIAYVFGKTAHFQREKVRPVIVILEAVRDTILASWPRTLTPLLVFVSILAAFVTRPEFFETVSKLVPFLLADLLAINFLTLVVLPVALLIFAQAFALPLANQNFIPLSTAVGTASSGAAYPLAQYACRMHHTLSEEIIDFSLPLLNVINKPGSVTHVTCSIVYHSLVQYKTLSFADFLVVIILTPIVTIGGASLPSSSLLTQVTILGAINLSADSIYLLSPVDWMLDRFRTLLNIWADIAIAKMVDKFFSLSQRRHMRKSAKEKRGSTASLLQSESAAAIPPKKASNPFRSALVTEKKSSSSNRKKQSLFD